MKHRRTKLAAAGLALATPALCHAVDAGSAAYRNGRIAGTVVLCVLLFLVLSRLPGLLRSSRWLVIPGLVYAL